MTAILVSMTTYRKHNGQMLSMCKDINIGRPRANFLLKIFEENTRNNHGKRGTGKFIHLYTTVKGNKSMERKNFSNAKLI